MGNLPHDVATVEVVGHDPSVGGVEQGQGRVARPAPGPDQARRGVGHVERRDAAVLAPPPRPRLAVRKPLASGHERELLVTVL